MYLPTLCIQGLNTELHLQDAKSDAPANVIQSLCARAYKEGTPAATWVAAPSATQAAPTSSLRMEERLGGFAEASAQHSAAGAMINFSRLVADTCNYKYVSQPKLCRQRASTDRFNAP